MSFKKGLSLDGLKYYHSKIKALFSNTNKSISDEVTRATSAENTLTTNLNSEISRAKSAESTLTTNLNNEITRATNAENTLSANKLDKTTVATSSTLGLVKSGTDITVDTSGNVSVNDNSHKHTVSNVDGLQSALDGKASSSHTHSSYVNQNAFSNINIYGTSGSNTKTATLNSSDERDTFSIYAGSNVSLSASANYKTITINATDTTYGVATSSALGLVKSGTDITVDSSGNVSVNDDSHNHVISNIDGLEDALASKYESKVPRPANTFLAAPNGSDGVASFRKLVANDLPSHTHNYAGSSSAGGSASSAESLKFLVSNPTSSTTYYIPYIADAGTTNALINNGLKYTTIKGTTDTEGYGILVVGNPTASGTAGNKYGAIRIYSTGANYSTLKQSGISQNLNHYLPTIGGTILNTGTTSYTPGLTSGANVVGTLKINGSTFKLYSEDTRVNQELYSENYNLPLLMSYQTNTNTTTNVYNKAYRNNSIYANPSTGTVTSTNYVANNTITANGDVLGSIVVNRPSSNYSAIKFVNKNGDLGYIGIYGKDQALRRITSTDADGNVKIYEILDQSNYTKYCATASHGHSYLNLKASNPVTTTSNDTTSTWGAERIGAFLYRTKECLIDQPSQYGFLLNIGRDSEVHQLWMTQSSGNLLHRGGNSNGWNGTWRTILDSNNYKTYCTPANIGAADINCNTIGESHSVTGKIQITSTSTTYEVARLNISNVFSDSAKIGTYLINLEMYCNSNGNIQFSYDIDGKYSNILCIISDIGTGISSNHRRVTLIVKSARQDVSCEIIVKGKFISTTGTTMYATINAIRIGNYY